ncbi:NTP transferase domain-containing protein [Zavarzinia sp. CC-PAN008]|uniref:NTP transferase domain-containing protein n=1 Tax=Zavarzinia sp. CC-PAN008 TaxID=3243332 RepID=UPI003F746309
MRFGPVRIEEAEGAILAHGISAGTARFKKGRILSAADCSALAQAGIAEVVAARLDDGDVAEDQAARELAAALAGPHAVPNAPFTGRANLYAEAAGLVLVDAATIAAVNAVDEALTVATLAPFERVDARQMLATIKVIPFSAPRTALDATLAAARARPGAVALAPFRALTIGLVSTVLSGTKASVLDKTEQAVAGRTGPLGCTLLPPLRVAHEAQPIAEAVRALVAQGAAIVLVFGASAIVDRRDSIPAGIEAAGGVVERFGMPVDPGNLLLLGRLGTVPVVGLPGCARSPKRNGFDFVLERLVAGLPVGDTEIAGMGVGGLLSEIPTRPQPRDGSASMVQRAPRIAAVVLAAGRSSRMGGPNKLVADVHGSAMVARVVDAALASDAGPVLVVTGHQAESVRAALGDRPVTFVHNPHAAQGLSTSLKAGIAALPGDVDGAIVLLGDMPRVSAGHIDTLIAAFNPVEGRAICVATHNGKRGNPVLWGRDFFAAMAGIEGDVGAKHLIGANADLVCEVALDRAVLTDIDTPEALAALLQDDTGTP